MPQQSAAERGAPKLHTPKRCFRIVDSDEASISSDSLATYMVERQEARAFRNAFLTEISDLERNITFSELVDVIVCAGKNTSLEELSQLWPFDADTPDISYDEGLYVFKKLPTIEGDYMTLLSAFQDEVPYDELMERVKEENMPASEKEDIIRLLMGWQAKQKHVKDIEAEMTQIRQQLLELNDGIVRRQKLDENALYPLNSSTESLSSVFSNTRNSQVPLGDQPPVVSSARIGSSVEKASLKSLVIQKTNDLTISIGYTFTLTRSQQICVGFRVNEKIDPDLNRFQNHLIGYVTPENSSVILAVTKRKDGLSRRTEWMHFPSGSYTFSIKFVRRIKVIEPNKESTIVDNDGKLTKEYKVMLMNTFDMFDLDDDGLLTKEELDTYRALSGSGPLTEQEWARIKNTFKMRHDGLTIKGFIDLHQDQVKHMSERQRHELGMTLKELGYNKKFYMSTGCPVWMEIQTGDGLFHINNLEISYITPESDWQLLDYYWTHGINLPYMKELSSVRLYKTEYFAVVLAGRMPEKIRYKFDFSASNNVNILGDDFVIDVEVEPDEVKVLTIAIAQAESWFLCAKKLLVEPNLCYPARVRQSVTEVEYHS